MQVHGNKSISFCNSRPKHAQKRGAKCMSGNEWSRIQVLLYASFDEIIDKCDKLVVRHDTAQLSHVGCHSDLQGPLLFTTSTL